ncbi:hypothetical protein BGP_3871 [Beggiatoa sp. PS]|nr:hypothetical protein BGP_3871 [Beggiatoa sp. PS]
MRLPHYYTLIFIGDFILCGIFWHSPQNPIIINVISTKKSLL